MAIRGSLREASLPDVLQLLAMGKKTGCLSVTHRSNFGYIYFERGRIAYASIVNRRDRLGDLLVNAGLVTREQLEMAIEAQRTEPNRRLGDLLISRGIVTREALHEQVRVQIEEAVFSLFTWSQGTFNFEPDIRPEDQAFIVSISPESLLLEGARRVDEWGVIEETIPSFDIVFEVDAERVRQHGAALTPAQDLILGLLDGRRDVRALIDESGLSEFDAGKALCALAAAGIARRVGRTRTEPEVSDARVEEHRNLGVAFYKTGMFDEALREFRRVMELRPADAAAPFYLGLVLIRQGQWAGAVEAYTAAAASPGAHAVVLHNLAFALERLGRLDDAAAVLDQAAARAGDDPRVRTSLGALALRRGEVRDADALLTAARPLWGTRAPAPAWFHFAGLAAALLGDLDRAAAILTEGTARHPRAAALHNNLAVVQERVGSFGDAAASLERALQEDATVPQVHKNTGDLAYRTARYDEELDAYTRATRINPTLGPDAFLRMGNIRYRRGEATEAITCWQSALALDPTNGIARSNIEAAERAARARP